MHNPDHEATSLIREHIARQQEIWSAMVDEAQDPQTLARIESQGKRTDKD